MHVVQSGDTLQSIAAGLWGDGDLWYKIAEVNGLTAESALPEGLALKLTHYHPKVPLVFRNKCGTNGF